MSLRPAWFFLSLPLAVQAQQPLSLPVYHPMNPVVESRTGLYFQPYVDPRPGWHAAFSLDYASAIEMNLKSVVDTAFLLDAEVLRLNLQVRRDVGRRDFVTLEAFLGGAYDGFLDGFVDWYHGLLGITYPERQVRPRNLFAYRVELPSGTFKVRRPSSAYLGDLRFGVGHRWTPKLQSHLSGTAPTSTAPTGYGRGTVSVNLINTYRSEFMRRLTYEGSLGLGYTPKNGDLSTWQRETMLSVTSGLRYHLAGQLSLFGNVFYHSSYYHDTGIFSLDRDDLTIDFGGIFRAKSGFEWRLGMSEDLSPSGPAIDLDFRLGVGW